MNNLILIATLITIFFFNIRKIVTFDERIKIKTTKFVIYEYSLLLSSIIIFVNNFNYYNLKDLINQLIYLLIILSSYLLISIIKLTIFRFFINNDYQLIIKKQRDLKTQQSLIITFYFLNLIIILIFLIDILHKLF